MSGLLGLLRLSGADQSEGLFRSMCAALDCGAPSRFEQYANLEGSVRLAGFDAIRSSQMAQTAAPEVCLLLDGELYNEDLIGENPAFSLIQAWQKEGRNLLNRLNGACSIIVYEAQNNQLTLICDCFASRPLYYLYCGDYFAFSSQLKPLLLLPGFNPKISAEAVASFLGNGCILEGKCLLEGIRLLGPGQTLTIRDQSINVETYWKFEFDPCSEARSETALAKELADLLLQAVQRRIKDNDQYAILLSGGLDSRAILGCALRIHPDRLQQTITWGNRSDLPESDIQIASQLADITQSQHNIFILKPEAIPDHFRAVVRLSEGRTDAVG
ncbi:MAG: asparagine synthase-related protein, partial [bacterium]